MSHNRAVKNIIVILLSMVVGGMFTYISLIFLTKTPSTELETDVNKPIYWVAPMDANYKRDKPGKSPMGMDLVPVYEESGKGPDEGPGTIRISPDVVNNLGVRTTKVDYKSLHTEINTVGYVTYNEDKLVHIHPRVEGWIEKLHVKALGDQVTAGQPIYEIYSPELVNAQEELLLALDRKNTRLINAAENRLAALQLPKSAIDTVKETRKVQQHITFYSPQNGVVENLKIREGFYVKPGSTLMSIGDLSEVWVEAEVFERQASQVKLETPVTMTLDYLPGKTWQGQVDYIYPTLDAKTRTLKVRLRFKNEEGKFKPNMFAQIAIHTTGDEQALLIPKEALIRTGNQDRVVLALGEGSFKSIAVTVGRFDSDNVEILAGLNAGDEIVSSAQFLLDSESSKSSDFKRMHYGSLDSGETMSTSVWVSAKINSTMPEHKMLTLTHDEIPAWDWPVMTMDFIAADAIDFSKLSVGLTLDVEITKTASGDYQLSDIRLSDMPITNDTIAANSTADNAITDEPMSDRQSENNNTEQHSAVSSATVTGTINSLMMEHGMINISRAAIEKWNRPADTVDFITAKGVSLQGLAQGMNVQFTFEIRNGDFVIVEIAPVVDHSHH